MTVEIAKVGRHGRMELTFGNRNGQTIIRESYYEVPFKITRPVRPQSGGVHVILMHCTAGIFGGRRPNFNDFTIKVEKKRVVITKPAARGSGSQSRRAPSPTPPVFLSC